MRELENLLKEIRNCRLCAHQLKHDPRPVLSAHTSARVAIIGQAPGSKVHVSGVPWDDASGKRLRSWMNVSTETFYDETRFAIIPMGFCYPGKGKSGDLPPRPECAKEWHDKLLAQLPHIELYILLSNYALSRYLPGRKKTLTETVRNWQEYWPTYLPLPHPSPRNNLWLKKNPWFEQEIIPVLRSRLAGL